jgi:predicted secreted protein
MSTSALSSQGCTIHLSEGSPTSWAQITEVSSINGPSGSATIIDVTDLSSTAKEKTMGLMDEGQVTLDCNYLPDNAVHDRLRSARAAKELLAFKITFTDTAPATVFYFSAYVTGFAVTAGVDQALKVSVTLEITGAVRKDLP